ncbi:hypothetical protein U8V72_15375 [Priestia filamentosa]|uniref:hypothetical protein n=1 Tax=Priestia filamentosa TaxID=1402861 RepID=UPI000588FAF4
MKRTYKDTLHQKTTNFYVKDISKDAKSSFKSLLKSLKKRGWKIRRQREIIEGFPVLVKHFYIGEKENLKFKAERHPTGLNLEFFMGSTTFCSDEAEYDSSNLDLMPYLVRLRFLTELKYIKHVMNGMGYKDISSKTKETAYQEIMKKRDTQAHSKLNILPLSCAKDKDGKLLQDGQIKYFRDQKGRLQRGVVYHNLNNIWWIVVERYEYVTQPCSSLFDLDTEENRKRKVIQPSGFHNPKSRIIPLHKTRLDWKRQARRATKEERVQKANELLKNLYQANWLSKKLKFYLKDTRCLGLLEIENITMNTQQVCSPPRELKPYGNLPVSETERVWVRDIREYIVYGKPTIFQWFCEDKNGYGDYAHKWADIREECWKIGILRG